MKSWRPELDALGVAKVLKAVVEEEGYRLYLWTTINRWKLSAVLSNAAELLQWPYCPMITKLEWRPKIYGLGRCWRRKQSGHKDLSPVYLAVTRA